MAAGPSAPMSPEKTCSQRQLHRELGGNNASLRFPVSLYTWNSAELAEKPGRANVGGSMELSRQQNHESNLHLVHDYQVHFKHFKLIFSIVAEVAY